MPDWRKPQDYDFTKVLTADQWAWEFLRRNPDYRHEWQRFIATWRALEADYGRPSQRDIAAWKWDPRAWVPAESCRESDCRIDGDKVLIECALGARWGFYKFPPDPADDDPVGHDRLVWREVPQESLMLASGEPAPEGSQQASLVFDLGLPLAPQLDQAKRRLQIEQRRRIAAGLVTPARIADHTERLIQALRLLDGVVAGVPLQQRAAELSLTNEAALRAEEEALFLRDGGYPQLLWLRSQPPMG
jgi:hypothetical protein